MSARLYQLGIAIGTGVLLYGNAHLDSHNIAEFICYLCSLCCWPPGFKVTAARIADTMSVNFLFVLIGVLDLSFTETLMLGSRWRTHAVFL